MRISSHVIGALILIGHTTIAGATLIDGFEAGLARWEFLGDVSVRTLDIGAASEGTQQALITTLCDSRTSSWCEVTNTETPYSGTSSVTAIEAASFLGFGVDPDGNSLLFGQLPTPPENGIRGESGVMRTRFFATAGSVLSFDWRHYAQGGLSGAGQEGDSSYFSLWSDAPGIRVTDYLWSGHDHATTPAALVAAIDLCSRVVGNDCSMATTYETGYLTRTVHLPSDGWYWLGFGMFEGEEGTVPSALSLDNVTLTPHAVPEPGILVAFAMFALVLGLARRGMRIQ